MNTKKLFKIALFAVPVFWLANWGLVKWYYSCDTTGGGTFGDLFGASNALFSGLTIIGLLYTIYLQQDSQFEQRFQTILSLIHRSYKEEEVRFAAFPNVWSQIFDKEKCRFNSDGEEYFGTYFQPYLDLFQLAWHEIEQHAEQHKHLAILIAQLSYDERVLLGHYYNIKNEERWKQIKSLLRVNLMHIDFN